MTRSVVVPGLTRDPDKYMPRLEGQPLPESAFAPQASEPPAPLDWSAEETVSLKTMAVEMAALRGKIESRASTPAEELRFKNLVEEMKGRVETKESKESGPEFRELVDREREALKKFFGFEIQVPSPPGEVTPEKHKEWKENGFELRYLPKLDLSEVDPADPEKKKRRWKKFPGWTKPPGKGPGETQSELPGGWVLMDMRRKPTYANGGQMYESDDAIGKALAELRAGPSPSIERYESVPDPASRFGIRGTDFDKPEVRLRLAEALGLDSNEFDLAYGIENSVLMHMYRPDWGNTDSYEWLKDKSTDGRLRLYGGGSDDGGLSDVGWGGADSRSVNFGFRPLGRFSQKK